MATILDSSALETPTLQIYKLRPKRRGLGLDHRGPSSQGWPTTIKVLGLIRVQTQLCVSSWNFVSHVKVSPKEWAMGGISWHQLRWLLL